MPRPRTDTSKSSLMNLGMKPEEDKKLIELLDEHDLSVRQLCRQLIRQWMHEGGHGLLKTSKK